MKKISFGMFFGFALCATVFLCTGADDGFISYLENIYHFQPYNPIYAGGENSNNVVLQTRGYVPTPQQGAVGLVSFGDINTFANTSTFTVCFGAGNTDTGGHNNFYYGGGCANNGNSGVLLIGQAAQATSNNQCQIGNVGVLDYNLFLNGGLLADTAQNLFGNWVVISNSLASAGKTEQSVLVGTTGITNIGPYTVRLFGLYINNVTLINSNGSYSHVIPNFTNGFCTLDPGEILVGTNESITLSTSF